MNLSKLQLGTKLLGGFALVLAIALAQGLLALYEMNAINAKSTEISVNWLPSVAVTGDMNTVTSDVRVAQLQHVLASQEADKSGFEKDLSRLADTLAEHRKRYEALISSDEERGIYQQFAAEWSRYMGFQAQVLAYSNANQQEQAQSVLNGDARKAFDTASSHLLRLVELNQKGGNTASAEGDALYATGRSVAVAALLVMVVLGLAIGWTLSRSIARRMAEAQAAAEAVSNGQLDRPLPDEDGDEVARLLGSMERMRQSLARVVSSVRTNADSVATASAQIAQGNQDLSQRTEEQASALEETAASMEELGSTVRHNADNAKQASQLARSASTVAVQGGEVVGQVVETMKHIQASSSKIADIIGVIDGIAFQTNILALNAAVEAARAGEQGRGFAVVAGEVRTLAQRSADAAKEIKALISASVERVEQGTTLVGQAGDTMHEVVASIQRVNDIMGEISSASSEQSAGVAQVGQAVSQMDQATQQNAALVEESAAAAESLKQQAEQLVRAVAVFTLAHEGSHRAGASSHTPHAPAPAPQRAAAPAPRPAASRPAPSPATAGADGDWTDF